MSLLLLICFLYLISGFVLFIFVVLYIIILIIILNFNKIKILEIGWVWLERSKFEDEIESLRVVLVVFMVFVDKFFEKFNFECKVEL